MIIFKVVTCLSSYCDSRPCFEIFESTLLNLIGFESIFRERYCRVNIAPKRVQTVSVWISSLSDSRCREVSVTLSAL